MCCYEDEKASEEAYSNAASSHDSEATAFGQRVFGGRSGQVGFVEGVDTPVYVPSLESIHENWVRLP
jgi:hypothetical protein